MYYLSIENQSLYVSVKSEHLCALVVCGEQCGFNTKKATISSAKDAKPAVCLSGPKQVQVHSSEHD